MSNITLQWGERYLQLGWSIFPTKGKAPYFELLPKGDDGKATWEPYQTQIATDAQVAQWFSQHPNAGIGVIGGQVSGLIILDIDDSLALHSAQKCGLPNTPVVKSGKGWHFYFAHPGGDYRIKNVKLPVLGNAEIKAEGGYCVAPPSSYAGDSKRAYVWDIGPTDAALAQIPDWLAEMLQDQGAIELTAPLVELPTITPIAESIVSTRGKHMLDNAVFNMATAQEHTRNDTLNRLVYGLGGVIANGELERSEVERKLYDAALVSGLAPEETRRTIQSGIEKGIVKPLSRNGHKAKKANRGDQYAVIPVDLTASPVKLDPDDDQRKYILRCLGNGEIGDARLIAEMYAGQVIYDAAAGKFYLWAGHAWQEDTRDLIANAVHTHLVEQYRALAWIIRDEIPPLEKQIKTLQETNADSDLIKTLAERLIELQKQQEELLKRATLLCNARRVGSVLSQLKTLPDIAYAGDSWDIKSSVLPVPNGVLLLDTGELLMGQPDDYLRTICPTVWAGIDAPVDRWERFTSEIMGENPELVSFIQRWIGYSLLGLNTERRFVVFTGVGANGKDVFVETLARIVGPFAQRVSSDVILAGGRRQGGSASPHIVDLQGRRLCYVNETEQGAWLNAAQVKSVTGGGTLEGRAVFGRKIIRFEPTHTLTLISNYKPRVNADDKAFWDRCLVVPFGMRFVDKPTNEHERQRDPFLKTKLLEEKSGILAWCVRGAIDYLQQGLNPPEIVEKATQEYQAGEDTLLQFIEEVCDAGNGLQAAARPLYENYRAWYEQSGLTGRSLSIKDFKNAVEKAGYAQKRVTSGNFYIGISIARPVIGTAALNLML